MTLDEHFASLTDTEKDAAISAQAAYWLKETSLQYLKTTDWYVIRKADTGVAIPDDVLAKRAQARIDASE